MYSLFSFISFLFLLHGFCAISFVIMDSLLSQISRLQFAKKKNKKEEYKKWQAFYLDVF